MSEDFGDTVFRWLLAISIVLVLIAFAVAASALWVQFGVKAVAAAVVLFAATAFVARCLKKAMP